MEIYFPAFLRFRLLVPILYTFFPSFFLFLSRSPLPFVCPPPAPLNNFLPRVLSSPSRLLRSPRFRFSFSALHRFSFVCLSPPFFLFPLFIISAPRFSLPFFAARPSYSSRFFPFLLILSPFSKIFLKTIDKCDILYYTINTLIKLNPIKFCV